MTQGRGLKLKNFPFLDIFKIHRRHRSSSAPNNIPCSLLNYTTRLLAVVSWTQKKGSAQGMRREHQKISALVRPKVGVQLGSFLFFLFASLISCKRVPGTQGGLWLNSHTHPLKSPAQGGSRRGRGAWWRNLGNRDCDGNWRAWKRMRGRRLSGCRLTLLLLSSFLFSSVA